MTSAADIEVPDIWPDDPMGRIRQLIERSGSNRNDMAITGIIGCIAEGFDTKSQIMDAMLRFGFKRGHAGAVLTKGTGPSPTHDRWNLDNATGRYTAHPL